MSLDNLSANELARIDSICLAYESNYRRGNASDISEIVSKHDGPLAELLRAELELVRDELQSYATIAGSEAGDGQTEMTSFRVPDPGTALGPYVVGETIGRGGMGVVLEAIDRRLDRRVAIKMLATDFAKRADLTERFDREARSVATISHPNIVELFDVGSHDGLPYAVMEYLDGELLSDRMSRQPFSVDETRDLGAQIADALAKAHESDVIHRDLKPQNIMLVPRASAEPSQESQEADPRAQQSLVKLFDFGLSRASRDKRKVGDDETQEGVILGTPGYMAPEQALGEPATASADIFALGCILFEALYGKRAFEGSTKIKRHQATLVEHPDPDPIRRREDPELAQLIDQCLAKDPGKRPTSAAVIARQLRHRGVADPLAESMRAGESAGRFTRRRLIELAAGGTVGGVFAVFLAAQRPNKLANIHSIGVLTFSKNPSKISGSPADPLTAPEPIGDARLSPGEELSAMLVHELTRIPSIIVPPFRQLSAELPTEYEQAGALLNVDALLDGSIRTESKGEKKFLTLDARLVSAKDGSQLWSKTFRRDADTNLLQQSQLAADIAAEIGLRLTSSASSDAPPNPESFSCLVDGKVRCDPDSTAGLKMALMCLQKAHESDIRFAEPLAGLALTSITLAAQSSESEAVELIQQAREKSMEALKRSKNSIDARLAIAMLDWQQTEQYAMADQNFRTLLKEMPNNWQIYHQYALLQLAMGKIQSALDLLNAASLRNPFSVTVKTDLARAHWFAGDVDRALNSAIRIRDKSDRHPLSVGLLVDIYEQQQNFPKAAAVHRSIKGSTREAYLSERRRHLEDLPYGPFGVELNAAILRSRMPKGIDSEAIAGLVDSPRPPMLPLVLAMHPAFEAARGFERSQEVLRQLGNTRDF